MKIAVLGAGSWGTTLANLLAGKSVETHLWVREKELLAEMRLQSQNSWYLPGIDLHGGLQADTDLAGVVHGADMCLVVVPCQFLRQVLQQAREHLPKKPVVVCASKGIEIDSLKPMSQVVRDSLGSLNPRYAILSGPSFAREVVQGMPTAVSLGCGDKKLGRRIQDVMSTESFRVYTNEDYKGVELGGALKNIIAIAAGISDGLGFGTNARAALITRGLSEMSRLGRAMGARERTFMGLSGMGDLVLTCTGDLSRNRQVGLKLATGRKLLDILGEMKMVAEGVKTTEAVHDLGKQLGVELPITEQVHAVLYEDKEPGEAVKELMTRELKEE